ncbi:MAG: SMC-Scp complex subunit ScpB [Ndongobacter sp.]|nr:SMC-Scp complex subunit ScpB [Ndongobacter sp.]
MDQRELKSIIEGLLYLWGEPLPLSDIARVLDITPTQAEKLLIEMGDTFEHERRGLRLHRFGDSFQLLTRTEHADFFSKLITLRKPPRLTNSSMETLAIIAYKQPITRIEVDNIRGVKSASSFDTLLARGLIEEAGRLDKIGRPILYRTSEKFLRTFDLESLSQLPAVEELEMLLAQEEEHSDAD